VEMQTALIYTCLAMVALVFTVGLRMLMARVNEMKDKRIDPQSAATSLQMASKLQNVQAADNFRNLFEVPVLFYALVAIALATGHVPGWLVTGAWGFVSLRYIHSFIQCTYNKVMHRFAAFGISFLVLVILWVLFVITVPVQNFVPQ
jgi:hypothetical protein